MDRMVRRKRTLLSRTASRRRGIVRATGALTAVPPVTVIGVGGGQLAWLYIGAHGPIISADVLVGGERLLNQVQDAPGATRQRIIVKQDVQASVEAIRQAADSGKRVVVLASGDPLLFGIGATLVRELGRNRVRTIPAASSVQLALAQLGEPWHDATVLSAHGRPISNIVPGVLANTKLAILTDGENTPSAIAGVLMQAGVEDCRAVVCEQLGCAGERLTETTLYALPDQPFDPLNVLLLFRAASSVRLRFGLPDEEFETARGQITKAEVRAVTLSKLRLSPNGVLWDIGAGCGSVSIEAALLMPRGAVYAVERDSEQRACLERNIRRHGAWNVHIVAGEAPEALAGLPAPDSVFLGGTGGCLAELLDCLPKPLVMNLTMPEHLGQVLDQFPAAEFVQLSVARSAPIGDGHRLAAVNPTFVVSVPA